MNIIYFGEVDFLRPNASSNRILFNSKSITLNNTFNIKLIGVSNIKKTNIDNFEIYNLKKGITLISKIFYYLLRGLYFVSLLIRSRNVNAIIYYGTSTRCFTPIFLYCKIKKIKIICDIVEWHDYSHQPFGCWGPIALDIRFFMNVLSKKSDGIIAISNFLENYYKTQNIKTTKIPIIINQKTNETQESISEFNNNYINIIYAGFAGKKDSLQTIINAINIVNNNKPTIKFHVVGTCLKNNEHNLNNVVFYGKKNQNEIITYLSNSDFSILIRPNKRYAHAGFPTKFVESLSAGIPVIANITSDIGFYLKDEYNGLIVPDDSLESIVNTLIKATKIDKNKINEMSLNAKKTAKEHFDYICYSEQLNNFITNVIKQ